MVAGTAVGVLVAGSAVGVRVGVEVATTSVDVAVAGREVAVAGTDVAVAEPLHTPTSVQASCHAVPTPGS